MHWLVFLLPSATARCTSIVVGRSATGEGGPLTSHTVDCFDCDFRLSKVPRKTTTSATRPVYRYRAQYPRFLGKGKGKTYEDATKYYGWTENDGDFAAIGEIPETVEWTYGYVDGTYGVINEAGLAIGESTCAAELIARPVSEEGGSALLDIRELSLIAMERCATAACAVETMGTLAEVYGYYGADASHVEAGEALTVVDREDAWVFHVLADDTGTSAVWAARRVAHDEIAVVANQFVIGDVPAASSVDGGFAFSQNVRIVAARAGLWANGEPLHFAKTFGQARGPLAPYATRRQWRVFSLALGDDALSSLTDPDLVDEWGYEFSMKLPPTRWRLGAEAVMSIFRDHYEGTKFDMTRGLASGAYGDPARFDPADNRDVFPHDGVSATAAAEDGRFERAISLFRCAYSFVSQPRNFRLEENGDETQVVAAPPMVWVAQYAPHSASYVPVFAEASEVPKALAEGSLHEVSQTAQYWPHALVGNWAARFYVVAMPIVKAARDKAEQKTRRDLADFLFLLGEEDKEGDATTTAPPPTNNRTEAVGVFAEKTATASVEAWWGLFWDLAARVKDGQRLDDLNAEKLHPTQLFYRKSWLEEVGFYFKQHQQQTRLFYVPDPHETHDWFRALPPRLQLAVTFVSGSLLGVLVAKVCCQGRR